jgi:hypothetical protein
MWDPGTLVGAALLVLPLSPPLAAPDLTVEPSPTPGDACVAPLQTGPVLFLGGPLRACPGPQRPTPLPRLVPLPGPQPSEE